MSAVNESLIRDVVAEVLGRLGKGTAAKPSPASSAPPVRASAGKYDGRVSGRSIRGSGAHGVFQDANAACSAAQAGFLQLKKAGVAARAKIIEIIKAMADANATEWGRLELDETQIGRLDHKIEKLKILKLVPGVEWLHPDGRSGDHGITLEEYTPFGLVAAITPSTHSIPTLSGNIVNIVAAVQCHLRSRGGTAPVCYRGTRGGEGGNADREACHLRRPGQPTCSGGPHGLHETGRQVHHSRRGL